MATGWEDYSYPTLSTDIVAQSTGNLNTNLAAQSLATVAVDLTSQASAQVITRTKDGTFYMTFGAPLQTAFTTQTLLTITGKGVVNSFFLSANHSADGGASYITATFDGQGGATPTLSSMNSNGLGSGAGRALIMPYYDGVGFDYVVRGWETVTFESSAVFKYYNGSSANVSPFYLISYNLL